MYLITPIKDLRDTSEISDIVQINRMDFAIFESEKEMEEGGECIRLDEASGNLKIVKKYCQEIKTARMLIEKCSFWHNA